MRVRATDFVHVLHCDFICSRGVVVVEGGRDREGHGWGRGKRLNPQEQVWCVHPDDAHMYVASGKRKPYIMLLLLQRPLAPAWGQQHTVHM